MNRPDKHGWPHELDDHDQAEHRLLDFLSLAWPLAWRIIIGAALAVGAVSALWLIAIANGEVVR